MTDLLDRLDGRVTDAVDTICPLAAFGWWCVLTGSALIGASVAGGVALYMFRDVM